MFVSTLLACISALSIGTTAMAVSPRQVDPDTVVASLGIYGASSCGAAEPGISVAQDLTYGQFLNNECVRLAFPATSIVAAQISAANPQCEVSVFDDEECLIGISGIDQISVQLAANECLNTVETAGQWTAARVTCF
jgi:hypothetical protein